MGERRCRKMRSGGAGASALGFVLLVGVVVVVQVPQQANSIKTPPKVEENSIGRVASEAAKSGAPSSAQSSCQYEKGHWTECNAEGIQLRTMRLKSAGDSACEPIRTIRRDCKTVGCKYARGDWSESCQDGHRVRVDKLVARIGNATSCKPERRVTKDCRRTCHYIKSAWTECINGTKTRSLTLDAESIRSKSAVLATAMGQRGGLLVTMAPIGQHCVHSRLVRRLCRAAPSNLSTTTTATTTNELTQASSPPGRNNNLTASQRRRLKLQQLKQANKPTQQLQQQRTTTQGAETSTNPHTKTTSSTQTPPRPAARKR